REPTVGWGTMEAAFFDLDKTIISRSSSLALSRPLFRAGMVTRSQLLRGAYAQLVYLLVGADENKMERLKEGMLSLTRGWDREEVEQLVREVIFEVIDPYVYQEAPHLHRVLLARGGRATARATFRHQRRDRDARGGRRGRPLHRRAGLLR